MELQENAPKKSSNVHGAISLQKYILSLRILDIK